MKLIAITQRTQAEAGHLQGHDMLDPQLSALLFACGLLPLILPNVLDIAKTLLDQLRPSGILLSGGNDTPNRHALEQWLIEYAKIHNLPLLGICHGMQAIQRYHGITCQPIEGHVTPQQTILINQREHIVNAYHDQGTRLNADPLTVWANHTDGTIKAIKVKQHPIYGIMWHPEREATFYKHDLTFIKSLYAGEESCEHSY